MQEVKHNNSRFRKIMKNMFSVAVCTQVVIIILLLVGYIYLTPTCEEKELSRQTSPDATVDAIIIGKYCHTTTSYLTTLYFVPANTHALNTQPIIKFEDISIINSTWLDDDFYLVFNQEEKVYDLRINREK